MDGGRALVQRSITLRELSEILPRSHGGELSDEEFTAVAGGSSSSGLLASATIGASVAATISMIVEASA